MSVATVRVPRAGAARATDRERAERRLGWMLAGPAFFIMLAVTAYPILNALYLSLFDERLTDPDARSFVGLKNYWVILSDGVWWQAVWTTVLITAITVAVELVIGMTFAMVMNKIIFGRGLVRTSILIPYAIITVVSAYAWQYAFASDSGFVNSWFNTDTDWFGSFWPSLFVICLSEIWKTTSFMSLLLLAGLA